MSPATSDACDRAAYYILNGQYDRALTQLDGARASGSSSAANELLRGLATMLDGDARKAIEIFDGVIAKEPALVEAQFNRAVALLKLGETTKAATEFARIANDEKAGLLRGNAAYHHAMARERLGHSAEAEKWLESALALDPKFHAARLLLGSLQERRGAVEAAAGSYRDYLKAYPESALALLRFGICAHRAGRTDVAATYLRRVIEKAPRSPEATEARKFLVMWE
ncbi:MAG TPA: tetratricopeptide repeat protein [Thermoanaerobaculia bacterium]|nr:tetratricopeptide repeat protein [Thermoanaerobaculia bacterium]